MERKARPDKVSKKSEETTETKKSDNSETFKNRCLGISAIGTLILEIIKLFLGM
jgi:hypothetical protein